ncbi:MAG: penicillin-binding protein 1A [Gammaproteobacteria bacterium]|nr:penicillin-binding protein 1A [Gammaproteobacteria bacterium]
MKWLWRLLKIGLTLAVLAAVGGAIAIGAAYYYLEPELPDIDNLRDVRLQVPLKVLSRDGGLIAEFGEKHRIPLKIDQIPERMVRAFMSAEDANFYDHPGVDYRGLLRAGVQLALTGKKTQGGSTITMQVARNFYLTSQKTYTRKLSEIFLALRIENQLSKSEILELYLNKIYLGHRAYGVGAAARVYYGKTVDELDLAQTAMIAGLPKAPSNFNPLTNPPRAVERRNYVLGRMRDLGYITAQQHDEAVAMPVTASRHTADIEVEAPYVAEMVRSDIVERFGDDAYTGGYTVYTTIDAREQSAANTGIRNALDAYSERHGYYGPEERLDPLPGDREALDAALADRARVGLLLAGIVTQVDDRRATVYLGEGREVAIDWEQMNWAKPFVNSDRVGAAPKKASDILAPGDVIRVREVQVRKTKGDEPSPAWRLAQVPRAAGALIALDPADGAVRALVGGYDFYQSKFNRVTQAFRQPGSGFKPFIYSAALENGFTPASLINDAPVVFDDPSLEGAWRPENASGKFFGPTRLREALAKSRNLVSIRLLRSMGIDNALAHIARFGFNPDELPHNLSLALGSASVTPWQMARGYAILANGGYRVEPHVIERIEQDGEGVVFRTEPPTVCSDCVEGTDKDAEGRPVAPRVLDARNRFLMVSMMQDVIRRGTATKARELGRSDLAGKTGTTNDQRDAWFNGFNQKLVANAWVGFDDNSKLGRGEYGGKAALPAWMDFMRVALKDTPETELQEPPGIVTVRIDPQTGAAARAGAKDALFEVFRAENAPSVDSSTGGEGRAAVAPPPTQDLF